MRRSFVWLLLGALAGALWVTGAPARADQRRRDLIDRTFVSRKVTKDGEPRPLVPGTRIELTFEERKQEDVARWEAGCNILGGTVDVKSRRLFIGRVSGTQVGCKDELHEQDAWLRRFFKRDPFWKFRNRGEGRDRLLLRSKGTRIKFVARD